MLHSDRHRARDTFFSANGLSGAKIEPLPNDASFRKYFRLSIKGRKFLLMDAPPEKENIVSYIRISKHLALLGLKAPAVFQRDLENGFLIVEDFGDSSLSALLNAGADPIPLYYDAIDALVHLHRHPLASSIDIPSYDMSNLLDEAVLLTDWHWPEVLGSQCSEDVRNDYIQAWIDVLKNLPTTRNTLVLRDYHVGNLMHLPKGNGLKRLGILDFQDALIGPTAYDLVSLIEDARRDNFSLTEKLLERYFERIGIEEENSFKRWYNVLGAHRHAKCAGIFVRLWRRDGKKGYLKYVSHVVNMLSEHLRSDDLAPLAAWFYQYYPKFKEAVF
ncbi:MAG: hypothetical protein CFH06_00309 [Alphaproteobacteria bacterium MarineAlpha3_Bin5]|nr:aminoglycoside phosphotransferase [Magnetovibrio sp.]PPR79609.1 MAG: hypothetical protein CFH06_00309 [Alphaproteobacteria bacterium MarineAlpha3_Bin5]